MYLNWYAVHSLYTEPQITTPWIADKGLIIEIESTVAFAAGGNWGTITYSESG